MHRLSAGNYFKLNIKRTNIFHKKHGSALYCTRLVKTKQLSSPSLTALPAAHIRYLEKLKYG
jgi:hypothetical protein